MSTSLSNLVSNLSAGLHNDRCIDYMDSWKRFDETSLPDKEAFYSNLKIEYITDVDYSYRKKVFEYLVNKNVGDCHEFYVHIVNIIACRYF